MTDTAAVRVVALDGPAGSGKSTVARMVAVRLGLEHLDTGAMYRGVAWACLRDGLEPTAGQQVAELARRLSISVGSDPSTGADMVLVDGTDVTDAIRTGEIDRAVGPVASNPAVRAELVQRQRQWVQLRGGGVLEGRDIATVVFPDAFPKIYLTASEEERARRRSGQNAAASVVEVAAELARRDRVDSTRAADPLKVADGAMVFDTTGLSIDQVVDRIVDLANGTEAREAAEASEASEPSEAVEAAQVPVAEAPASTPAEPAPAVPARAVAAPFTPAADRPAPVIPTWQRRLYTSVRVVVMLINRGWFKATYEGLENVPATGPFILSPMHRSYVDTLVVAGVTKRRMRFLGKDTMWKWKWFRPIADGMGGIKIHREATDRESMKLCLDALASGEPLVVYPEGRRKEGPIVEDLFDGPAFMAVKAGVPVVPVGIGGSADAMGKGHKFPHRKHIHVIVGTPLYPPVGAKSIRRAAPVLTEQLRAELQRLFEAAQLVVHGHIPS